jgi:proteic killer suppression protein
VNLHGGVRLVFESADDPVPIKEDGTIAWNEVTKVCIVFIGDYHD